MPEKIIAYKVWEPTQGNQEGRERVVWGEVPDFSSERYKLTGTIKKRKPATSLRATSPPPPTPAENICGHCGAISFFPVDVCDLCKAKSPAIKMSKTTGKKKRSKMSFDEFEAGKVKLNRLKNESLKNLFKKRPPAETKKLEEEIRALRKKLEDNIYLAFLFDPSNISRRREPGLIK